MASLICDNWVTITNFVCCFKLLVTKGVFHAHKLTTLLEDLPRNHRAVATPSDVLNKQRQAFYSLFVLYVLYLIDHNALFGLQLYQYTLFHIYNSVFGPQGQKGSDRFGELLCDEDSAVGVRGGIEPRTQRVSDPKFHNTCVLLAVALYDTNTTILGRRILTTTLSDERNAYNPLNRQEHLTLSN